jgi:hypothetical protein
MKERQAIRETNKNIDTDRQRDREAERKTYKERYSPFHNKSIRDRQSENAGRHADITKRSNKIGK